LTIKNYFSVISTTSVIYKTINLSSYLICANEVAITSGKEKKLLASLVLGWKQARREKMEMYLKKKLD
jgi:hypothetical protein